MAGMARLATTSTLVITACLALFVSKSVCIPPRSEPGRPIIERNEYGRALRFNGLQYIRSRHSKKHGSDPAPLYIVRPLHVYDKEIKELEEKDGPTLTDWDDRLTQETKMNKLIAPLELIDLVKTRDLLRKGKRMTKDPLYPKREMSDQQLRALQIEASLMNKHSDLPPGHVISTLIPGWVSHYELDDALYRNEDREALLQRAGYQKKDEDPLRGDKPKAKRYRQAHQIHLEALRSRYRRLYRKAVMTQEAIFISLLKGHDWRQPIVPMTEHTPACVVGPCLHYIEHGHFLPTHSAATKVQLAKEATAALDVPVLESSTLQRSRAAGMDQAPASVARAEPGPSTSASQPEAARAPLSLDEAIERSKQEQAKTKKRIQRLRKLQEKRPTRLARTRNKPMTGKDLEAIANSNTGRHATVPGDKESNRRKSAAMVDEGLTWPTSSSGSVSGDGSTVGSAHQVVTQSAKDSPAPATQFPYDLKQQIAAMNEHDKSDDDLMDFSDVHHHQPPHQPASISYHPMLSHDNFDTWSMPSETPPHAVPPVARHDDQSWQIGNDAAYDVWTQHPSDHSMMTSAAGPGSHQDWPAVIADSPRRMPSPPHGAPIQAQKPHEVITVPSSPSVSSPEMLSLPHHASSPSLHQPGTMSPYNVHPHDTASPPAGHHLASTATSAHSTTPYSPGRDDFLAYDPEHWNFWASPPRWSDSLAM